MPKETKGFGKKSDSSKRNYKTIFERIKDSAKGEEKTFNWYRQETKKIALSYRKEREKFVREERKDRLEEEDNQDENQIRRFARSGRVYLFEYKAVTKWLPYYDTFPLVMVLKANKDHFIGANLHYLHPTKRLRVIQKFMEDRIDVPRCCIHKYITDHVEGFLLDLAIDEWETAIALPVENFVTERNKILRPYKSNDVWKETNTKLTDRLKGRRILKGYGKPEDIEDVTDGN